MFEKENLINIRNIVEKIHDTFEVYVHLLYSFILIVVSIGLIWAFYFEPLKSLYHDVFWENTTGIVTDINYAYRSYTENFENIHIISTFSDLEKIQGEKNTYFIFIDYEYKLNNKSYKGKYSFNNMGDENKDPFFNKINKLNIGQDINLKVNPNNFSESLPQRETKLNGKEDNLYVPALWIIFLLVEL